jgi:hypothetical protein
MEFFFFCSREGTVGQNEAKLKGPGERKKLPGNGVETIYTK